MNFKIGDLVRFVDEPIEGHITSFLANGLVGVTDDTGFEIPVMQDKITLVHGNMRMEEDEEPQQVNLTAKFIEKGIFLALTGEQKDGLVKFFIANETSYELLVAVKEVIGNKCTGIYNNVIPAREYNQIYTANFANINKWPNLEFQILRTSRRQHNEVPPIEKTIKVKALDLINSKERSEVLPDKAWLYELDKIEENIGLDKLKAHFISHRPK
ncbi:hypothetical protein GQF61_03830 [Sphingobacterium sp. DK4209]|uniref:Uncharacterized protein n=1 Tax=Sphingobacterium zhuxiongii TaxID=2662364 RepID=A0A5Q0Q7H4_9SPHI|nr:MULTISPECIES: hypothetical protein [unclassified Sphingobacterium]MVZ64967.1 hypothetical protein [Sphingobacterium sp. DK4209]QGA25306.1 hypothetical protein GFH32_02790 [Sphingobacterium sp. dk4302]